MGGKSLKLRWKQYLMDSGLAVRYVLRHKLLFILQLYYILGHQFFHEAPRTRAFYGY